MLFDYYFLGGRGSGGGVQVFVISGNLARSQLRPFLAPEASFSEQWFFMKVLCVYFTCIYLCKMCVYIYIYPCNQVPSLKLTKKRPPITGRNPKKERKLETRLPSIHELRCENVSFREDTTKLHPLFNLTRPSSWPCPAPGPRFRLLHEICFQGLGESQKCKDDSIEMIEVDIRVS